MSDNPYTPGGSSLRIPVIPLLAIGVLSGPTYNVSRGHDWARMSLLVAFVLGSPVLFVLQRTVIVRAISFVIFVLVIVALYLVFTGDGARWFRRDNDSGQSVA